IKSFNPFNLDGSPSSSYSRMLLFIDVDDNPSTGYSVGGYCGSELLVNGTGLYRQSAGTYNAGDLSPVAVAPTTNVSELEMAIPLAQIKAIAPTASKLRIVLYNDDADDYAPDFGTTYQYQLR